MAAKIGTNIEQAISILLQNKLVAIPTETVYGLAGNALNAQAVTKIFETKNRPFFNPLIIHVSSVDAIKQYAELNSTSIELAQKFMPGSLTLLLPKKDIVPDLVTAGSTKVAVRIPNHPITQKLLQQLPFPLAAPSANEFGYVSPVTAQHVYEGIGNKIDYILDGGACTIGIESTIVEATDNEIIIHRVGGVAVEDIEQATNKPIIFASNHQKPQTSGQLKSHYATHTPLIHGNVEQVLKEHSGKKIAIISFNTAYNNVDIEHQYILAKDDNIATAAQNLFSTLRLLDTKSYDIIVAEIFPDKGLGKAINDRLQRAQFIMKN